jgi:hypothetical protein
MGSDRFAGSPPASRKRQFAASGCSRLDDCHMGLRKSDEMNDELDDIQTDVANSQSTQIERDKAFCARMRWAIEAGLERAPIGVITTLGTKNPRYVATERRSLVSSQRDVE